MIKTLALKILVIPRLVVSSRLSVVAIRMLVLKIVVIRSWVV
jgi:hypothetical protein